MNKKAKVAIWSIFFGILIAAALIIPFMGKAQAGITYNNDYTFTPSEIRKFVPLAAEKDDNWQVEWHETYSGLTHREYVVAIQNQKDSNNAFGLSVVFNSLNFDASKITNVNLLEWKNISREIPVYETIEICDYDNVTNSNCHNEQAAKGAETAWNFEWAKVKDITSEQLTTSAKKDSYDNIIIDSKKDEENSVRYFKLSFDVPITRMLDGKWGSQGKVAFIEENSGKEYHPTWNYSLAYKRVLTFNNTVTNKVKVPYIINGSAAGVNNELFWTFPEESFNSAANYSEYIYYNNWSDFYVVNSSENASLSHNGDNSAMPGYNSYQVWQANNVPGVWHLNSTLNSANNSDNLSFSGTSSYVAGKFGYGRKFNGAQGTYATFPDNSVYNNQNFTACAWINLSSLPSIAGFIFYKSTPGTSDGWGIDVTSGGVARMQTQWQWISGTSALSLNQWYLICGTYDSTKNATIYVNGIAEKSAIQTDAMTYGSTIQIMGRELADYYNVDGVLDELIYFSRTLSPQEVKAYYEQGVSRMSYLGPEMPSDNSIVNESDGNKAIQEGIAGSVIGSPTNPPLNYTNQQIYAVYMNNTQKSGRFDVVAVSGNKRWAFNYYTSGGKIGIGNIEPSLYTWEGSNLNASAITQAVKNLIDSTN